ncbi:hypothetical protein BU26DRAFT_330719 [Trematosphaeria pertusa]|uniref:Extracellular membrane protein CFEM domain-containing protein n=1 Tax=Trematosphaeria pertusa TaxID=390896 RepID=A0A6A6IEF5_9PLEO|nr:uncharacterized protein BU26DRAFT_330719 [Trematosphaeria pertusa]KAF2248282.1 hypothetical protein BU26DRAFT_330719 [Trematosphaeria pertusa]
MHLFAVSFFSFLISSALATPAPTPAPELSLALEKRDCAADNCLRAMRNRISTAVPFCSTYTTDAAVTIPTWATAQCASNPTRVTSACGCLAVSYIFRHLFTRSGDLG